MFGLLHQISSHRLFKRMTKIEIIKMQNVMKNIRYMMYAKTPSTFKNKNKPKKHAIITADCVMRSPESKLLSTLTECIYDNIYISSSSQFIFNFSDNRIGCNNISKNFFSAQGYLSSFHFFVHRSNVCLHLLQDYR